MLCDRFLHPKWRCKSASSTCALCETAVCSRSNFNTALLYPSFLFLIAMCFCQTCLSCRRVGVTVEIGDLKLLHAQSTRGPEMSRLAAIQLNVSLPVTCYTAMRTCSEMGELNTTRGFSPPLSTFVTHSVSVAFSGGCSVVTVSSPLAGRKSEMRRPHVLGTQSASHAGRSATL